NRSGSARRAGRESLPLRWWERLLAPSPRRLRYLRAGGRTCGRGPRRRSCSRPYQRIPRVKSSRFRPLHCADLQHRVFPCTRRPHESYPFSCESRTRSPRAHRHHFTARWPPSGCRSGIICPQRYHPWVSSLANLTANAAHPARTSRTVSEPGGRMRPSSPAPERLSSPAPQVVLTEPPLLPALQEPHSPCRGELLVGVAAFAVARRSFCLVRALLALELLTGELGVVGEQLLSVARVVPLPVEDLLPGGHDRGHQGLSGHVHSSAAHVQQRVDRQQQPH